IGITTESVNIDDIIETANHFRCIDIIIERAVDPLSEDLIKELHRTLKSGTSDSKKSWFVVGDYKKLPNEVGGNETTSPAKVSQEMKQLLKAYNSLRCKSFEDIIEFHHNFEAIHPFQDGNGRVGRLIIFKECLATSEVPFIINDELKMFYHRGLQQWGNQRGYLLDTCLSAQDDYKAFLDYFEIKY
ncbi:MAG: Fic family protein, partial [Bacteroidales bacterium]